jgi:integrase
MAHLFGPKRIREKEGRGDRPLVMQPNDQSRKPEFIKTFNGFWPLLSVEEKKFSRPKWGVEVTEALMDCKPNEWQIIFTKFLRDIRSVKYFQAGRFNPSPMEHVRPEKRADLISVMARYNEKTALTRHSVAFPYWKKKKSETLELIKYLLQHGTLWNFETRRHLEIFESYQDGLSVQGKENLKRRIKNIQELLSASKTWWAYFKEQGVVDIRDVLPEHFENFEGWRIHFRCKGDSTLAIRRKTIRNDFLYIRRVFRDALSKDIIQKDPSQFTQLIRATLSDHDGNEIHDEGAAARPFELETLRKLFKDLYAYYLSRPNRNISEWTRRNQVRLNLLSCVFCMCLGNRPKEINEWVIKDGQIAFIGGKTKNAKRVLPISPTLQRVVSDPQFSQNIISPKISTRLTTFLKRNFGKEYTCYRFRHSVATILLVIDEMSLQEIAYWMGHVSSVITEEVYGNMKVLLNANGKENAKIFWTWFNTRFFEDFPFDDYQPEFAPIDPVIPIVISED